MKTIIKLLFLLFENSRQLFYGKFIDMRVGVVSILIRLDTDNAIITKQFIKE